MAKHRVAFLTRSQKDVTLVEQGLAGLDCELDVHICNSDGETIEAIKGADVIIAHGVFMPRAVCRADRYGQGDHKSWTRVRSHRRQGPRPTRESWS